MSREKPFPGADQLHRIAIQLFKALLFCFAVGLISDALLGQSTPRRSSGSRRPSGNPELPAPRPAPSSAGSVSPGESTVECGTLPQRYRQREYGSTLYALEHVCRHAFTVEEQVFIAGLAQGLLKECGFPADPQSQRKLLTFLTASGSVATIGADYSAPRIRDGVASQTVNIAAYTAGDAAFKAVGCTPLGSLLADGIVAYLDLTSSLGRFVDGCARYYEGRYTRAQCQCVADVMRAVEPEIYTQEFSRDIFPYITRRNPFVGLQFAMQCRVGDY